MEFFRRLFNKPPQPNPPESPYAGENALAEHEFFASGEALHGGENSSKRKEMTAVEINAPFEAKIQETKIKEAREREIQIALAKKEIERIARKKQSAADRPEAIKTVVIDHSPLPEKPKVTVLRGGAKQKKESTEKINWHKDNSTTELPISGEELLNEHTFFGAPKKTETTKRIQVSELSEPTKKSPPADAPATEKKRAA